MEWILYLRNVNGCRIYYDERKDVGSVGMSSFRTTFAIFVGGLIKGVVEK